MRIIEESPREGSIDGSPSRTQIIQRHSIATSLLIHKICIANGFPWSTQQLALNIYHRYIEKLVKSGHNSLSLSVLQMPHSLTQLTYLQKLQHLIGLASILISSKHLETLRKLRYLIASFIYLEYSENGEEELREIEENNESEIDTSSSGSSSNQKIINFLDALSVSQSVEGSSHSIPNSQSLSLIRKKVMEGLEISDGEDDFLNAQSLIPILLSNQLSTSETSVESIYKRYIVAIERELLVILDYQPDLVCMDINGNGILYKLIKLTKLICSIPQNVPENTESIDATNVGLPIFTPGQQLGLVCQWVLQVAYTSPEISNLSFSFTNNSIVNGQGDERGDSERLCLACFIVGWYIYGRLFLDSSIEPNNVYTNTESTTEDDGRSKTFASARSHADMLTKWWESLLNYFAVPDDEEPSPEVIACSDKLKKFWGIEQHTVRKNYRRLRRKSIDEPMYLGDSVFLEYLMRISEHLIYVLSDTTRFNDHTPIENDRILKNPVCLGWVPWFKRKISKPSNSEHNLSHHINRNIRDCQKLVSNSRAIVEIVKEIMIRMRKKYIPHENRYVGERHPKDGRRRRRSRSPGRSSHRSDRERRRRSPSSSRIPHEDRRYSRRSSRDRDERIHRDRHRRDRSEEHRHRRRDRREHRDRRSRSRSRSNTDRKKRRRSPSPLLRSPSESRRRRHGRRSRSRSPPRNRRHRSRSRSSYLR